MRPDFPDRDLKPICGPKRNCRARNREGLAVAMVTKRGANEVPHGTEKATRAIRLL